MRSPIVIYSQFDVVIVPFPFTDKDASKRRPALVLSGKLEFNETAGHSVMAMITTASHSSWFGYTLERLRINRIESRLYCSDEAIYNRPYVD